MSKKGKTEVTATVVKATKETIVKTGERFLDVEIQLVDGKTKKTFKRGYPYGTTPKEVEKELKQLVKTYELEKEQAVTQATLDEEEAGAEETIEAVQGLQV